MESYIRHQKDIDYVKNPNPKHIEVYGQLLSSEKENGRLSAHRTSVKPGGEIVPHTHEVLEVIYVLEGEGSALVNGERVAAGPGTLVVANIGSVHGFLNTGASDLVLFCVFSPGIA